MGKKKKKKAQHSSPNGLMKTNTNAVGLPLRRELPGVNSAKLYKELIPHSGFLYRERAQLSIKDQCIPKRVTMVAPQGVQKPSLFDSREGITLHNYTKFLNSILN